MDYETWVELEVKDIREMREAVDKVSEDHKGQVDYDAKQEWDYGNHDELHRDCSCFYAEKPVRYKDIMGGLDRPQSDDVDFPRSENPNQIKGDNNMDLNALLDNISDIVRRGQDQLYGLEDKRNSIENIESEIQDAVSSLEGIQSDLEIAVSTVENLEDYLIPEAENITAY